MSWHKMSEVKPEEGRLFIALSLDQIAKEWIARKYIRDISIDEEMKGYNYISQVAGFRCKGKSFYYWQYLPELPEDKNV